MSNDRNDLPAPTDGFEPGRTLAASNGSRHRDVLELPSLTSAAKQQSASTHVAPANELAREQESLAEHVEQGVDVLPRRDATEEHDAGVAGQRCCDVVRIAPQWSEVALVS